jgi:hypothetical protein
MSCLLSGLSPSQVYETPTMLRGLLLCLEDSVNSFPQGRLGLKVNRVITVRAVARLEISLCERQLALHAPERFALDLALLPSDAFAYGCD